jgi:uncharacterized repeat protein (TIGR01451 family)
MRQYTHSSSASFSIGMFMMMFMCFIGVASTAEAIVLDPIDLRIVKTVDDATVEIGQTITYTLTVTNNSGFDLGVNGVVRVDDELPDGFAYVSDDSTVIDNYSTVSHTWDIDELALGASKTLHIVGTVSGAAGNVIVNTATVYWTGEVDYAESTPADNTSSATITINTPPAPSSGGGGNGPIVGASFTVPVLAQAIAPQNSSVASVPSAPTVLGAQTEKKICVPYLTHYLRQGKRNDAADLAKLRLFLRNEEGMTDVSLNGDFDAALYAAVTKFQEKYTPDVLVKHWGIQAGTGYVYITTRAKINELHCLHETNT